MTARLVGAATAAVMLLALSACTDEPSDDPTAPSFEPAPSTSAPVQSPAPSESPSTATSVPPSVDALAPPALPAAAAAETPEGAAAFAEWWFATLNYATATGDTAPLRAAFLESCGTCENFATRAEDAYGQGGSIRGGMISVQVDVPPALQDGSVALSVFVDAIGGQILDANGGIVRELNPEKLASAMAVVRRDNAWRVSGIR